VPQAASPPERNRRDRARLGADAPQVQVEPIHRDRGLPLAQEFDVLDCAARPHLVIETAPLPSADPERASERREQHALSSIAHHDVQCDPARFVRDDVLLILHRSSFIPAVTPESRGSRGGFRRRRF